MELLRQRLMRMNLREFNDVHLNIKIALNVQCYFILTPKHCLLKHTDQIFLLFLDHG